MQKKITPRESHRKQIRSLAKSTKLTIYFLTFFSYIIIVSSGFASNFLIHHTLTVIMNSEQSKADIYDVMSIPRSIIQSSPSFRLTKNSTIKQVTFNGKNIPTEVSDDGFVKFKLLQHIQEGAVGPFKVVCNYSLPLAVTSNNMKTLFISGKDFFYPQLDIIDKTKPKVTFQIKIQSPSNIKIISQGKKLKDITKSGRRTVVWEENKPQEEILLIADHYHEFLSQHEEIDLYAYLRDYDNDLAKKYFKATKSYIDLYSKLIAPYPYKKFALVENSQQTGYGMPSFTLLGSRVIRFPFILHTSYPHEILHNWFGNGVYIDPNSGNWAEGLTSYLADHLLLEQSRKGRQYRFQELMKYSSYVNETNDFPLIKFKGRDSMASQAIGYGKMLMVFHMLRLEVGDTVFINALRNFYNNNQYSHAGFKDIQVSFESTSGRNLEEFFSQWILRKGAPQLNLLSVSQTQQNGKHRLKLEVKQIQPSPTFKFRLPIAVWLIDKQKPRIKNITISKRQQTIPLSFSSKPLKVTLDPYHDVFRRLNPNEVPPNIGSAYGANIKKIMLPKNSVSNELHIGYKLFAQSIKTSSSASNNSLKQNPKHITQTSNLWVFGKNNKLSNQIQTQLNQYDVQFDEQGVTLDGKYFNWQNHCFVFTLSHHNSENEQIVWIVASSKKSIPGLIRKLPHYSKYGYLVFEGDQPSNVVKGTWPSNGIGVHHTFTKGTYPLPSTTPLVQKNLE